MQICQMIKSKFYIEAECERDSFVGKYWIIFVYVSTDESIRKMQWDYLKQKRSTWGKIWVIGGDLK